MEKLLFTTWVQVPSQWVKTGALLSIFKNESQYIKFELLEVKTQARDHTYKTTLQLSSGLLKCVKTYNLKIKVPFKGGCVYY